MLNVTPQLYRRLQDELRALLADGAFSAGFRKVLRAALEREGKLLSSRPRSRWPFMVLLPCWAVAGDWQKALPGALAAELLGAATDVFDELEDGDDCPLAAAWGAPRVLNAASALLVLALQTIGKASQEEGLALAEALLAAADGQHRDLGAPRFASPKEYLALVDRKSGMLTAALCAMGARLGEGSPAQVAGCREFGRHMGRWAQLLNDLHGVWPGSKGKSDLARRLTTLPIVYVLRGPDGPAQQLLQGYLAGVGPPSPAEEEAVREALLASGALHYTWLIAEMSRTAAERALQAVCPERFAAVCEILLPSLPMPEQLDSPNGEGQAPPARREPAGTPSKRQEG